MQNKLVDWYILVQLKLIWKIPPSHYNSKVFQWATKCIRWVYPPLTCPGPLHSVFDLFFSRTPDLLSKNKLHNSTVSSVSRFVTIFKLNFKVSLVRTVMNWQFFIGEPWSKAKASEQSAARDALPKNMFQWADRVSGDWGANNYVLGEQILPVFFSSLTDALEVAWVKKQTPPQNTVWIFEDKCWPLINFRT